MTEWPPRLPSEAATLSLLTGAYPPAERNKAVGVWAGVAGIGALVGFLGAGLLLEAFTFRAVFWAFAIAAAALALLALTASTSRDDAGTPVDWTGGLLIGAAMAALVLGLVEIPVRGWSDELVWGCFGAALVAGAVFVVLELHRAHPLLDVRLFRRADFAAGVVTVVFLFFTTFGYFFLAMQHFQLVMGYGAIKTAFAAGPMAVPVLVLGVLSYRILARFGLRLVLSVGLTLMSVGLLCMRFLDVDASYWEMLRPMIVMSCGVGVCTAPATFAITAAVPDEKQGVASAVNDAGREVGAAIGVAVAGSVLAAEYSRALAPDLVSMPEPVRGPAMESLARADAIAETIGPMADQLTADAKSAFVHGMSLTSGVLAASVAAGAIAIAIWAPGRDSTSEPLPKRQKPTGPGGRHRAGRPRNESADALDELGLPVGNDRTG